MNFSKKFKKINDFSVFCDAEWDNTTSIIQEIKSEKTSRNIVPRSFNKNFGIDYVGGTLNFDIGGGKFDKGIEAMKKNFNVENVIYDPYCRTDEYNAKSILRVIENNGADTITVNNCLNVIKGQKFIEKVIKQTIDYLKTDGYTVFLIYSGNKSGVGCETRDGYQQNKKAKDYVSLIHKYYKNIWLNNTDDCIIASNN